MTAPSDTGRHGAAYVTLLTKSSYLLGALVLHQSLRSVGTKYPFIVMATPTLPMDAREVLEKRGVKIVDVDALLPEPGVHHVEEHDARFADTWTKLQGFGLSEYGRLVLLDSDMIVLKNMDELMDLELPSDWIAAAHACTCNPRKLAHYPADWIPENCAHTSVSHPDGLEYPPPTSGRRTYTLLNSGLVVLNPSAELLTSITHHLLTSPNVPSYSFPDQDLLADLFKGRWKALPYCYNALKTLRIVHPNLWRDDEVKCLHFILADKPWRRRVTANGMGEYDEVHSWWWNAFDKLGKEMNDENGWKLLLENVDTA